MFHRALTLTLLLQALPAMPAAAGIPVVGQVLAPDGAPRAQAEVRLEPIPPTYERARLRLAGRPGPEPVEVTRSGADGTFELAAPEAGMWKVVVSAPGLLTADAAGKSGYAPGEATVTVAGGDAPEIEIRMTPTEGVSFEVALESGVSVPAVRVMILDPSDRRLADGSYPLIGGRVRVSTVPPGRWDMVIQAGDSAVTRFPVTSPGDQGRLVLRTGGILHLRVPELAEVAKARVVLTGPDGKPFVSTRYGALGPGEWVMSAGLSRVSGLVPGVWSVTVEHGGRTWSGSATVLPGATTEVSLP